MLFVRAENTGRIEDRFVRGAPDVVIEVSWPSTRRLDLRRKLELYERFGVPEYWFVDLQADEVQIFRLSQGVFDHRVLFERGDVITSPEIPGFSLGIDELLGPPS